MSEDVDTGVWRTIESEGFRLVTMGASILPASGIWWLTRGDARPLPGFSDLTYAAFGDFVGGIAVIFTFYIVGMLALVASNGGDRDD